MSFPIRCFTCGKVIGALEEKYFSQLESGKDPKKILNALGVTRYCCRRMFLGHVNVIDKLLLFENNTVTTSKENSKTGK